ncbi:DUF6084 family protein [Mycobacterium sp. CVI_P3]|uniref:DUF6084 family protein n=1 Tax=Mycobacterium pinniadriaticum TaxID=2994102 RepID=A0ABT3SAK2_9MYCO|nr:DUF6084 family protein [Mycobacterium pinniadriaticum]MCX2929815.1 DUF6084 family protein [Mycobacterium pinniadriaticum]MCX2936536.1 DUF6084 family protein [Mycobacterium pinniadriaticum]
MTADVTFHVLDVTPEPYAATPVLAAEIGIEASGNAQIRAIALRCQVRIEPQRRSYTDEEAAGLLDLFGPRDRWAATQRSFLWLHSAAMVPGFEGTTRVTLPLPCTYDIEVAGTKYFHALRDGAIPLQFLFSGTIFDAGRQTLAVRQVSWECEDSFDMPVAVWRTLMQQHYPESGWVRLSHDTIAELCSFKSRYGLLTVDEAVGALLETANQTTLCTNGSGRDKP